MKPAFLTLDEVLALHADQYRRYGGQPGLLDVKLLFSAIGTPKATFEGMYLHPTYFEMAAAYLFHICQNHPFIDGNQPTALAAALGFLWLNGYEVITKTERLTELVSGVARGETTKSEVGVFLQENSIPVAPAS